MIYDLHTHSNASDGILSPEELVSRAKLRGVTHLALTDHDTINGLSSARKAAEVEGIELINGVEFSSQWQGINIHIVGLNIDVQAKDLLDTIEAQHSSRVKRAEEIARRLTKLGIPNTLQGAQKHADGAIIGRPHFARYLIEIGVVRTVNCAFKQYLGAGKAGDIKQEWPELLAICSAIVAAGGTAVLAHPLRYSMTLTKLRKMVDKFREDGGEAIEVISGQQTSSQTKTAAVLAKQFDMLASCGSDFHVPTHPWQELGCASRLPEGCRPVWQAWH